LEWHQKIGLFFRPHQTKNQSKYALGPQLA